MARITFGVYSLWSSLAQPEQQPPSGEWYLALPQLAGRYGGAGVLRRSCWLLLIASLYYTIGVPPWNEAGPTP